MNPDVHKTWNLNVLWSLNSSDEIKSARSDEGGSDLKIDAWSKRNRRGTEMLGRVCCKGFHRSTRSLCDGSAFGETQLLARDGMLGDQYSSQAASRKLPGKEVDLDFFDELKKSHVVCQILSFGNKRSLPLDRAQDKLIPNLCKKAWEENLNKHKTLNNHESKMSLKFNHKHPRTWNTRWLSLIRLWIGNLSRYKLRITPATWKFVSDITFNPPFSNFFSLCDCFQSTKVKRTKYNGHRLCKLILMYRKHET